MVFFTLAQRSVSVNINHNKRATHTYQVSYSAIVLIGETNNQADTSLRVSFGPLHKELKERDAGRINSERSGAASGRRHLSKRQRA